MHDKAQFKSENRSNTIGSEHRWYVLHTLLCLTFLCSVVSVHAQHLLHREIVARPTDHSISIHAIAADVLEMSVRFRAEVSSTTLQSPWKRAEAGQAIEIELNNLEANTAYRYAICLRAPGASDSTILPEHSFHTARPMGESFRFIVQADPHMDENSDTALYRQCLQNQADDRADFMIDLGDFLMSDKLRNSAKQITHDTITSRCHLLRSYYETVCHSMPLMISLGNHEGESMWNLNGTANNVAVWGTNDRKTFFPNPQAGAFYSGDTSSYEFVGRRESYYSFQWGDALFIVLDPYWFTASKPDSLHGWRWTLGKKQYDWLRTTLEHKTARYTFVFAHQLVGGDPNGRGGVEFSRYYEWGGDNLDGTPGFTQNRPGWYKPIKDLLAENRVTIFFHGHDHFFGQQQKDCLIYQETPQPSLANFQSAAQAAEYGYKEGVILPNSGHLRVSVQPEAVNVEYVRAYLPKNENATRHNKDIAASYTIKRVNCYDSLSTGVPILWNADYADELIFPNPMSSTTTIELSVDTPQRLSVEIADELGHTVRHLLSNSDVQAGRFRLYWDGKDDNGMYVASGNYWSNMSDEHGVTRREKIAVVR